MNSHVHSLADASSRDNLRNHKNVKEEEERQNRIFGNVSKRSRYTKYVNVSPTGHFVKGMSAITPAVHRVSVLQSAPLSPVVLPCLQRYLLTSMSLISDIFPSSSELTNLSFGSAIPLVYRPRLLLFGDEGGLDHLGPAILDELEKFPIHSLRDPCLLSYPDAKTPEEALVHIFSEARRTTPSILYIRMFNNWWENAYYGNDYTTSQIVSRAHELHDEVYLMLSETIDPALLTYCNKIADKGGRSKIQYDLSGSVLGRLAPVVDMGTVTRTSARLPNVQPEVELERDSDPKEPKKTADAVCTDSAAELLQHQESGKEAASEAPKSNSLVPSSADGDGKEISSQIESVKRLLMEHSENYNILQMEKLYIRIMKGVHKTLDKRLHTNVNNPKHSVLRFLSEFSQHQANF